MFLNRPYGIGFNHPMGIPQHFNMGRPPIMQPHIMHRPIASPYINWLVLNYFLVIKITIFNKKLDSSVEKFKISLRVAFS